MSVREVDKSSPKLFYSRQATREREIPMEGFTNAGYVATVCNALNHVGRLINQVEGELYRKTSCPFTINGYIFNITVGLVAVLDGTASACQRIHPMEAFHNKDVYFFDYDFSHSAWTEVIVHVENLKRLQFNDNDLRKWGNRLKHESPWVGMVSENPRTTVYDVHGTTGTQSVETIGYVYGFIAPVYACICQILKIIFNKSGAGSLCTEPHFVDV